MYYQYALVSGTGPFPVDMLRYDRCCPRDEADSNLIARSFDSHIVWQVTVTRKMELKTRAWTFERWLSFGATIKSLDHLTTRI